MRHAIIPALLALAAAACSQHKDPVKVDGSSTVFLVSQAVAEEYSKATGQFVTVGEAGTGGGFKKFCRGEIDIVGASRPIKKSELEACRAAGLEWTEHPIAYDGLAVVVHPSNSWVDHLTVDELKRIWSPGSTINNWKDVRSGFPDRPLRLYGAGVDSGTYDYFTQVIVGKEHSSRGDFTSNEDDNVLVQGIAGDPSALGFFGYAYYAENTGRLKLVAIDDGNGAGPVLPSPATVADGTYKPLSRPVFIYVSTQARARPNVDQFVRYYLEHADALAAEVGYFPLPEGARR
jgi:phosphate transport system substrate-binding protein